MSIPGLQGIIGNRKEESTYWHGPIRVCQQDTAHDLVSVGKGEGRMDPHTQYATDRDFQSLSLGYHTTPADRYHLATRIQSEHAPPRPTPCQTHLHGFPLLLGRVAGGTLYTYKKYKVQRGVALPISHGLILHYALCTLCTSHHLV